MIKECFLYQQLLRSMQCKPRIFKKAEETMGHYTYYVLHKAIIKVCRKSELDNYKNQWRIMDLKIGLSLMMRDYKTV